MFPKYNLQPFPKQALVFTCLLYKSFENTVEKGEIAYNEQFLLFPRWFLPVWKTVCHFYQIRICRLQTVSLEAAKTCRLERVNSLPNDKFLDWSKLKAFADDKRNAT